MEIKHLWPLLLLIFVAAGVPSQLVHVTYVGGKGSISSAEFVTVPQAPKVSGTWRLEAVDRDGEAVAQVFFDPTIIFPNGDKRLVDDIHVYISTPVTATEILLIDENEREHDYIPIENACGDGKCSAGETFSCEIDCPEAEIEPAIDEILIAEGEEEKGNGVLIMVLILLLLILVLIGAFLIINGKHKEVKVEGREWE